MDRPAIVIFGAAVMPDGRPSPSLLRRIGYGLKAAAEHPDAPILCSGGVGRTGPSEASIMARVLRGQGVASDRLVLDEASLDTLQSVIAAARFVRRRGRGVAVVCSDRYHLPRIRLMLGALGVATVSEPTKPGLDGTRRRYWIRMHLREALAIPYDLGIVLARRREFMAAIAAD
jgi:vancomycin permeability regulator SanA